MAVDNSKLLYLLDPAFQIENIAGKPAVGGHIEVFYAGTDVKVITKQNFDGVDNPFKVPLNNDGRAVMLVGPGAKYDIYFYDSFNNLIFSRLNVFAQGEGEGSVSGLTQIFHDDTLTGDGSYHDPLGAIEYTGILPIDVNNDLHLISAQTTRLGVQEPLYFVQDDDERTVIGFSGTIPVPEGTMNESAFGYEAGQITSYNGSAFSAGLNYEAGSYIDIDGNTISVTGVQSAGDYVVHDELSSYATEEWVENQSYMKEYMESAFYPSTSNPSGYLTAHQDLSDYAKTEDLTAYQPVGDYYSASNPDGFINSDAISAMATTGFVADVSGDITALIPDTSDMATQTWVSSQGYLTAHQSLDGLMSSTLLEISDNKITGYNGTAFAGQGGGVSGDYELSAGSGISIVDYPLEQKTVISVTAQGGNPEVEQAVIDNSATWNTVSDKLDTTAFSDVSGTFLTAHQDLSDYQTIAGMTAYQPAGDYLTTGDSANFATTGDIEDLVSAISETYQPITAMTAYQAAGNYLSANALDELSGNWETVTAKQNALTFGYNDTAISAIDNSGLYDYSAHARINTLAGRISDLSSNKLDTTAFSDVSGTFLTAVPDTYLQNTDLSTTDGKVTAISGIPLSAGGSDVPEGVMVESGLEYNAVNEISAYNGSAIAQYGAEKQWLVHDDTLVHVSNSAQYALGVNLSAIAQLLGVDETLLWSGNFNSSGNIILSGSINDYKKVEVYFSNDNSDVSHHVQTIWPGSTRYNILVPAGDGNCWYQNRIVSANAEGTILAVIRSKNFNVGNYTTTATALTSNNTFGDAATFRKIIGIGRKS